MIKETRGLEEKKPHYNLHLVMSHFGLPPFLTLPYPLSLDGNVLL